MDEALQAEIQSRRADSQFMGRLAQRASEDQDILDQLADGDGREPYCVDLDWTHSAFIEHTAGPSYRLLFYSDTEIGFEHRCDRRERGTIICAPRLTAVNQPGGHQLTWSTDQGGREVPTVRASVLCPDCGTHGFITAGRWAAA